MRIGALWIVFIFSFSAQAQKLQPGLWKAKTTLNLNGLPLPASDSEECITRDKTKDVKSTIAKELKKKGCELTKWVVKGQKLEASLKCKNDDFEAQGSLHGTVTPKSYALNGEAEGSFKSIPSQASLELRGEWTKSCK